MHGVYPLDKVAPELNGIVDRLNSLPYIRVTGAELGETYWNGTIEPGSPYISYEPELLQVGWAWELTNYLIRRVNQKRPEGSLVAVGRVPGDGTIVLTAVADKELVTQPGGMRNQISNFWRSVDEVLGDYIARQNMEIILTP